MSWPRLIIEQQGATKNETLLLAGALEQKILERRFYTCV